MEKKESQGRPCEHLEVVPSSPLCGDVHHNVH